MNQIYGGSFVVARRLFESEVWLKPPPYVRLWIWILGQANHSDHQKHGKTYKRGEFLTTYDKIIRATAYYQNHKHIIPTIKQIRVILNWLQSVSMIIVKPIQDECPAGADPGADPGADLKTITRAYLGIKIVVVNYDSYQDQNSYKGRPQNRARADTGAEGISPLGHYNNNDYNNVKKPPAFFSLQKRYSKELIDQIFESLASTRKRNQIADSILFAQLQRWEKYPVEQVETGFRIYLDKNYAAQGKREEYLFGIIRNRKVGEPKQQSTGSMALDKYYAGKNNSIHPGERMGL